MEINKNEPKRDDVTRDKQKDSEPNAYEVEDDSNEDERDLKRSYLFGTSKMKNQDDDGMEGNGMGGHNFGENSLTCGGNDKDNPSQMAGDNNAYFNRTQPAEEHPENNNFKSADQAGSPNYNGAFYISQNKQSDKQSDKSDKSENIRKADDIYQEGTADDDGNIEN